MAYFSDQGMRNKLIVLCLLKHVDQELTAEQMYRAVVENEWMNYFDFQSVLIELQQDGCMAAVPRSFGQGYGITELGIQMIDMFGKRIPYSLREAVAAYAVGHAQQFRSEMQFRSKITPQQDGSFRVQLHVFDEDAPVFSVEFSLPTGEMAQSACKNWQEESVEIYRDLMERLVK